MLKYCTNKRNAIIQRWWRWPALRRMKTSNEEQDFSNWMIVETQEIENKIQRSSSKYRTEICPNVEYERHRWNCMSNGCPEEKWQNTWTPTSKNPEKCNNVSRNWMTLVEDRYNDDDWTECGPQVIQCPGREWLLQNRTQMLHFLYSFFGRNLAEPMGDQLFAERLANEIWQRRDQIHHWLFF